MENKLPLTVGLSNHIGDIAPKKWNQLVLQTCGELHPFSRHEFLSALEESGCAAPETGWHPHHVMLTQGDELVAAMPLYLKTHSQGEYVFDYGWADAFERAGGHYYPKFQCSIPFTPASAPKFLAANEIARGALLNAAASIAEQNGISSIHATFLDENELELAQSLDWLVRYDTQFHWANQQFESFDAFLQTLASRKRKAIKKERKSIAQSDLEIVWKTGSEITEADWDAFFEFYQDTGARKWGQPYLNRAFFSILTQKMPEQILLMFAQRDGQPIAGTLNFIANSTLYGRYWGCTEHVPNLHFELCYYQAIDYAIAHKLRRVEAGAQGEHKLARGYAPQITRSAHWIGHEGLRHAIADFLDQERMAVLNNQEYLGEISPFKKANS